MTYTVEFYALDALEVANRFASDRQRILDDVRDRMNEINRRDFKKISLQLSHVLSGTLPDQCDADWADAMSLIANCVAESVRIPELELVRKFEFIEQVGFIVGVSKFIPPFAIPKFVTLPPHIGFVPSRELANFAFEVPQRMTAEQQQELEAELADLLADLGKSKAESISLANLTPTVSSKEIEYVRDEMRSVFESIAADSLDLLTILR